MGAGRYAFARSNPASLHAASLTSAFSCRLIQTHKKSRAFEIGRLHRLPPITLCSVHLHLSSLPSLLHAQKAIELARKSNPLLRNSMGKPSLGKSSQGTSSLAKTSDASSMVIKEGGVDDATAKVDVPTA